MEEKEIKLIWKNLLTPFIIGLVIFIFGILYNEFGSKKTWPQTLSIFAIFVGLVLIIILGYKMFQFSKYLKNQKK